MPAQFTTNLSEVTQLEGVYAVEVSPPAPVRTPGADWLGYVGRFAWGPVNTPVVIDSQGQYLDTFAPAGLGYGYTGHQGIARAQPAQLKIVRVAPTGIATASMILQGPNLAPATVNLLNVAAKYPGLLGGSITITIAAADDGVAGHFNLTVTLGTESETYRNLSVLSGSVSLGDQTRSKFLAALSAVTANLDAVTRPVNGTYTLGVAAANVASPVAGADGAAVASNYTGTAGAGDAGLAKFEGDPDVTIVCVDDCTNALRVAVNTALVAHAVASNRLAVIQANSGTDIAAAITHIGTNAVAYRNERAIFAWPWVNVLDETGAEILVPPSAFLGGALTHMPRHLGSHWKDPRNTRWYARIARLEYTVGRANLILAKNAGVEALVRTDAGGIAPKSGVTTSLVATQTAVSRRRFADFVAKGLTAGQEVYEGGPIDPVTRIEQLGRAKAFLQGMKDAALRGEAALTEALDDFSVTTISSGADLAAGLHKIAVRVKMFATQDFIAFILTVGPTVTIEETLAAA